MTRQNTTTIRSALLGVGLFAVLAVSACAVGEETDESMTAASEEVGVAQQAIVPADEKRIRDKIRMCLKLTLPSQQGVQEQCLEIAWFWCRTVGSEEECREIFEDEGAPVPSSPGSPAP